MDEITTEEEWYQYCQELDEWHQQQEEEWKQHHDEPMEEK